MTELLGDLEAHRLLRRAYGANYRWPQGFGGFRASIYYACDQEHGAGSLEVRSPSDIRLGETLEGADGRLGQELASIVGHRWHLPYEEADGRHQLSLDAREHPLGRLVRVDDDGMGSSYRIQGGHISQIYRKVGGKRFSIHIQERTFIGDGRALPVHFCATYWDIEQERLVRTEIYRDGYITVGDVYLPLSRRIATAEDFGITTRLMLFRDHELIGEDAVKCRAG